MIFQTYSYWYYYLKKVCNPYKNRKSIQVEILLARYHSINGTLVSAVQYQLTHFSGNDGDRGLSLTHMSIMFWVHQLGPELNGRIQSCYSSGLRKK